MKPSREKGDASSSASFRDQPDVVAADNMPGTGGESMIFRHAADNSQSFGGSLGSLDFDLHAFPSSARGFKVPVVAACGGRHGSAAIDRYATATAIEGLKQK
jgi:hypothetical protein